MNHEKLALQWRRTKIIATLGPASDSPKMINQLMDAGVNVVRLNMSHGDHDSHRLLFKRVRAAAKRQKKPVAILMDLCGPKIRVGKLVAGKVLLQDGQKFEDQLIR